jgi:hypothetical protein
MEVPSTLFSEVSDRTSRRLDGRFWQLTGPTLVLPRTDESERTPRCRRAVVSRWSEAAIEGSQRSMPADLAQVCLFKRDGSALKRFCEIVSGSIEIDNGTLLSFHMGHATVAHHPPAGDLGEDDVLVTLQVKTPKDVDRIYAQLVRAKLEVDDEPEDTEWGWRLFYFRAARHLMFEVGAPLAP